MLRAIFFFFFLLLLFVYYTVPVCIHVDLLLFAFLGRSRAEFDLVFHVSVTARLAYIALLVSDTLVPLHP